ncbi:MAG: MAPEG family protein [Candidatus Binataceae bacterium]
MNWAAGMNWAGGMNWVAILTVLALVEYSVLGALVGRARVKYGVEAPATTGNPIFERYFRVHQNTLEALIVFIPSLWIFGIFVNPIAAASLGMLFIVARIFYVRGYLQDPKKRALGAGVTFVTNGILLLGGLVGVLQHWS